MKKIMNMALCVLAFVFASVTVFAQNPVVSFKPTKTVVCPGKTSSFINNSYVVAPAMNVKSFKWTFGPSCIPSEDTINWNPQNVIFSGGGTVYVMLEVIDDLGQKSNYGAYIIVPYYNSSPQISPQNIKTMCAGDSVTLNVQAGFSGTYQWTFNGGNISGATDSTYVVKSDGQYGCNVSDANGCSWGTWRYVQYNQSLNPKINTYVNNGKGGVSKTIKNGDISYVCTGDKLQASAQLSWGGPQVNVTWSNGDIGYYTQMDSIGVYSYTVSANGCTEQSDTFTVALLSLPVPVVTTPLKTIYCVGDTSPVIHLVNNGYANMAWGSNGYYYNYTTALVDSLVITSTGTYGVLVTDANGCSDTSAVFKFTFNPAPTKPIVSPFYYQPGCNIWSDNATGCKFQWFKDGTILAGETGQTLDVSKYGSGSYQVETTNASGCSSLSDPNYANCTATGLEFIGNGIHSVNFSSNPAKGSVTVYSPKDSEVLMLSTSGTVVRSARGERVILNLEGIQPGTYFVKTVSRDGKTIGANKILVQ